MLILLCNLIVGFSGVFKMNIMLHLTEQ